MSKLWSTVNFSPNARREVQEYKQLDGAEQEEHGRVGGDVLEMAEGYLLKRSLERKIFYLKISVGVLSILLFLSLLSRGSFSPLEKTTKLIPSPLPIFSSAVTTFNLFPIFSQSPNPASNMAWDSLLPPGRGFVYIQDYERYNLPPGEATPYGDIYSITVFHQLHCLAQLRRFTYTFLDGVLWPEENVEDVAMVKKMFENGDAGGHLSHCFDYLRQGLMCNADMGVEWPREEADGRRFAVDGWGVSHECKDWDQVMGFMLENGFNGSTNAEIAPLGGTSG